MSGLVWFRKDLRIDDNPALCAAVHRGVDRAIFISTPLQWERHFLAPIQADLIERHLNQLKEQLHNFGIRLTHLRANIYDDQVTVLADYCKSHNINTVYANKEIALDENQRDEKLVDHNLNLVISSCETIAPLGSIVNKQREMYKVFTPFRKAWLKHIRNHGIKVSTLPSFSSIASTNIENESLTLDYLKVDSSDWPLSSVVKSQIIPNFFQEKLCLYSQQRDFPKLKATSGLSPYLAIGAISARILANRLVQHAPDVLDDLSHPYFSWLNELIWRDFYKHLLFHFPNLIKGECFREKYQHLKWPNPPALFEAWCEGKTGYPIIDAAMKQLLKTGWMHNRLRMIVASFLTKHLLVDWRWGERFFMQHLIDGDFSANNGGWQWAAGTGCDAQPYFRIFNPITQSKKYDPNGDFIRKYLKELESVPSKHIHFPHDYLVSVRQEHTYGPPIVEHKQARLSALDFYK